MIVGASLDETVPVPCHVAADPLDVSFDWNFSNSGERFEVTSGQFNLLQDFHSSSSVASDSGMGGGMAPLYDAMDENSETIYELLYTPKSERDYGTLACWGKNSIGKQLEPCLFQVVPAAKPSPLRNCTLRPYSTLLATHGGGSASSSSSSSNSSAASASSSSSSFYYGPGGGDMETGAVSASSSSANGATVGQQYRESNYISTQFVKDRNVSNERQTNITKFNQKSTSSGTVSKRREQIKHKNDAGGRTGGEAAGSSGLTTRGRISAAGQTVGLTSDESDTDLDTDEGGAGKGVEVLMAAQISSALGQAASGSSSFSPSSESSSSEAVAAAAATSSSSDEYENEGLRTIEPRSGQTGYSAASSSGNSEGNNYHGSTRDAAPIAAKLRSENVRYNRYHSSSDGTQDAGRRGGLGPPSPTGYGPSHSYGHYVESNGGGGASEVPTTLELECVAGYDGGLPQHFFLEAYDSRTRKLRLNITSALSDVPLFRIDLSELSPSDSYTPTLHLIAYSVNQKGRSEPTILEDIAINEAEKRTETASDETNPMTIEGLNVSVPYKWVPPGWLKIGRGQVTEPIYSFIQSSDPFFFSGGAQDGGTGRKPDGIP
ncbi:conserved hypothetical protein [Culex quinquefasciatus]|uniref:Uncharacterized protein n=1 Tax=Culex quinquefasciatus TaxID=7176 RepID=B0WJQ3_CULQU|nr:conserved hypothetical protein [Culex quinquefasciatus]|eukprot:XP_001848937.1 conserved hypothetical protein [Culex quinquefasciatus]